MEVAWSEASDVLYEFAVKTHEHPNHDLNLKKIDRLSSTEVRLTVEMSDETVKAHEQLTASNYMKVAKIPGFRPGKAPLKMVWEKYRNEIQQDVISHLLEAGLSEALAKAKLVPVNRPRIQLGATPWVSGKPLEFQAEFEVQPEIELKKYKGVPLKKAEVEATTEEVEKTLNHLRDRFSVLEPVLETKAAAGLFASVEFTLEVNQKKEPNQTIVVELGKGQILSDLDAALLEMSVGEERNVDTKFPEDYHEKSLAGKEAKFELKLKDIKKKVLPDLNDAFAAQVKPEMTLEKLKTEIQQSIVQGKTNDLKKSQRQEIVDFLIENNTFDVPKSMVDRQSLSLLEWMEQDMRRRGSSVQNLKKEELDSVRTRAEQMVRSSLLLKEIAVKEKIELNETKVDERVGELATQFNQSAEETLKLLEGRGMIDQIRNEVLTDQVFDFLLDNVSWKSASSKEKKA